MRFLILTLALSIAAQAQEVLFRQVEKSRASSYVEATALFSQPGIVGYLPVRVSSLNKDTRPLSFQISFTSQSNWNGSLSCSSTFRFTVDAGKRLNQDVMVPLGPNPQPTRGYGASNIQCVLSGDFAMTNGSIQSELSADQPAVLLSEALFTKNASELDSALKAKLSSSGTSHRGNEVFSAMFDPAQLPEDWLGYSGYDSLILTDSDWTSIPPGARNSITSWVNLGGQLVLCSSGAINLQSLGLTQDAGFGSIHTHQLKPGGESLDAREILDLVDSGNPAEPQAKAITQDFRSSWHLQNSFGQKAFNYGLFILVLIVFSIIVGPVNLLVLAKSNKRHRLFLTTPIISLVASLILVAMIIFQDGFGGAGTRHVLMEVRPDQGLNAAYMHQEQFSRSGILTGSSFTVDPACFITPVPLAKSRWTRYTTDYNTKGNFSLQPDGGKLEVSGDWWRSRSEQGHYLKAVVPTRGRIEPTQTPGEFVSTFDFPLETIYLLDADGNWSRADDVKTGIPFAPKETETRSAQQAINTEANALSNQLKTTLQRAKNRHSHYIAVTEQAPGIETRKGIRWRKTRTIITGPLN